MAVATTRPGNSRGCSQVMHTAHGFECRHGHSPMFLRSHHPPPLGTWITTTWVPPPPGTNTISACAVSSYSGISDTILRLSFYFDLQAGLPTLNRPLDLPLHGASPGCINLSLFISFPISVVLQRTKPLSWSVAVLTFSFRFFLFRFTQITRLRAFQTSPFRIPPIPAATSPSHGKEASHLLLLSSYSSTQLPDLDPMALSPEILCK
jgi:hypothetical protein